MKIYVNFFWKGLIFLLTPSPSRPSKYCFTDCPILAVNYHFHFIYLFSEFPFTTKSKKEIKTIDKLIVTFVVTVSPGCQTNFLLCWLFRLCFWCVCVCDLPLLYSVKGVDMYLDFDLFFLVWLVWNCLQNEFTQRRKL